MIGLVLGDTQLGNLIIKKLKSLKKKFVIIDISKKKIFKKNKIFFPLSIGQLGKAISILKKYECKKIIFAGKVTTPNFYKTKSLKVLKKVMPQLSKRLLKFLKKKVLK